MSAYSAQLHPRTLCSNLPQGENSSVTDTVSTQSLSAPEGVAVRFPFMLSGVTHRFLTQPAMRMHSSCLISTGASQTIEYLPEHFLFLKRLILHNYFFPTFNIINKSCYQVMWMGENGVNQNYLHICTKLICLERSCLFQIDLTV